jgi:DNA-binding response OmpR family regulator
MSSPAASKPSDFQGIRVLLIDDDVELCELTAEYLRPLGFHVESVHTGAAGIERVSLDPWQAVLLDVMLPDLDGFEVLRRIRAQSKVPVLMLTGRGEEIDRVVGLELGADDYLPKTFSSRELLARLRSVLRRAGWVCEDSKEPTIHEVLVGPLRISVETRTALLADNPLVLTATEFDLLLALARAKGRVKSRDQLLEEIRGHEWEAFDRSIDMHISVLRKKLGDDPKEPRFIRTVRSIGYMLVDPTSRA